MLPRSASAAASRSRSPSAPRLMRADASTVTYGADPPLMVTRVSARTPQT
jgi:hypothetical protein